MKYTPIWVAPLALILFSACGSEIKKGSCSSTITPLGKFGNNVYFDVIHFDVKNKDCYTYLRDFGKTEAMKGNLPVTIHFMNQVGSFQPPADGKMYGSEEIRKSVICQYLLMGNKMEQVNFDPFGYGTYEEPK